MKNSVSQSRLLAPLLLVLFFLGSLRPDTDASPGRLLHVQGHGWMEADSLWIAALLSGALPPARAAATIRDGDGVTFVDGWVLPTRPPVPVEILGGGVLSAEAASLPGIGALRKLHLNGATAAELERLPGIGPTLAGRILAGAPYRSLGDLDRVKGIGPATIRKLSVWVEP